ERRKAKAVNFGVVYGISDYGLSQNIKISRREAKEYIEKYFDLYPSVKKYMDSNIERAKQQGFIDTIFSRRRNLPEITASNFQVRTFNERVAMNMPLQGSASDIIKLAMIDVQSKLESLKLKSKLILQIHDELIIDACFQEEEIARKILKESMENVVRLKVDLPVEICSGKNWFECK
ncbi:MAG: DNA polymerase, partial [Clostridia bacterium]